MLRAMTEISFVYWPAADIDLEGDVCATED